MAELDELERSLALAQIGLAAPPGVKQRVRAKLGSAAGLPPASPELNRSVATGPGPLLKAGASGGSSGVARRGVPTWGAFVLTGLGFAVGYLFGHRPMPSAGESAARASAVRTQSESDSALHAESLRGKATRGVEASPSVEPAQPRSARGADALMHVADRVEMEPNGSREKDPSGSHVKDVHTRTRATRHTGTPDGWAAELALLQRAERAIRADNSDLALALLDQLDREHPKPQLVQEREAARLLADCERSAQTAVGRPAPSTATERARQYLSLHRGSVYTERIRHLCGLGAAAASAAANTAPTAEAQPLAPDGAAESAPGGH
jgi:hypothetical protein